MVYRDTNYGTCICTSSGLSDHMVCLLDHIFFNILSAIFFSILISAITWFIVVNIHNIFNNHNSMNQWGESSGSTGVKNKTKLNKRDCGSVAKIINRLYNHYTFYCTLNYFKSYEYCKFSRISAVIPCKIYLYHVIFPYF